MLKKLLFSLLLLGGFSLSGLGLSAQSAEEKNLYFHSQAKRDAQKLPAIQVGDLAYELNEGQLELWSLKHRAYIRSLELPTHLPAPLLYLQQAGNRLLTLNQKGALLIWDGLTGHFLDAFQLLNEAQVEFLNESCNNPCPDDKQPLLWANDGQQLALVVPRQKMQVRERQTHRRLAEINLPFAEILALSADPQNAYLLLRTGKGLVYSLPDLIAKPGLELLQFEPYDEAKLRGPYLALGQETGLKVWDLRNQAQIFSWPSSYKFPNPSSSIDGFLVDLVKRETPFEKQEEEDNWPYFIPILERNWDWKGALRPFNRKISHIDSVSPWLILTGMDEDIHFIDLKTGKWLYKLHPPAPVTSLALSPSDLAVGIAQEKEPQIWLWNRNQKRWKPPLNGHEGRVTALRFLDPKHLLSAGTDQRLRIWNLYQPHFLSELELYPDWESDFSMPTPQLYNQNTLESLPLEWLQQKQNWRFKTQPQELQGAAPPLTLQDIDSDSQPTTLVFSNTPTFWLDLYHQRLMLSQNKRVELWELGKHSIPQFLHPCAKAEQAKKPCFVLGAQAEKDYLWALTDYLPTRKPLPGAGTGGPSHEEYDPEMVIYDPQTLKELRRLSLPTIQIKDYSHLNLLLYREFGKLYFLSDYNKVLEVDLKKGQTALIETDVFQEKFIAHSYLGCGSWQDNRFTQENLYCLRPDPGSGREIPVFFSLFPGGYVLMTPNGYFVAEGPYQKHVYLSEGNQIVDWANYASKYHRPEKVKAYFEGQHDQTNISIGIEKR